MRKKKEALKVLSLNQIIDDFEKFLKDIPEKEFLDVYHDLTDSLRERYSDIREKEQAKRQDAGERRQQRLKELEDIAGEWAYLNLKPGMIVKTRGSRNNDPKKVLEVDKAAYWFYAAPLDRRNTTKIDFDRTAKYRFEKLDEVYNDDLIRVWKCK